MTHNFFFLIQYSSDVRLHAEKASGGEEEGEKEDDGDDEGADCNDKLTANYTCRSC